MIRAFIAIDIPEEVRAAIEEGQARLKRAHVGVKISWTKIANLHLTLQFLGYIGEETVEPVKTALQLVAEEHQPFDIAAHGAGVFPNESRPRVLWVGCDDAEGKLKTLARSVQQAMEPLGFEPEHRDFSAHLTLGRIKIPRADAALTKAIDSLKNAAFGTLRVEVIHLFESQLHPDGSIYTKLSSHTLGAPNQKETRDAAKN
ncbi:MAG TPA: RNA 2',3'-cyclic phosphodiesterase [Verrucomicrobiae bacterium]|nr:RNA 2',3'-cyclic phosphodiesterase [Verrucomicrobiae bacterium]